MAKRFPKTPRASLWLTIYFAITWTLLAMYTLLREHSFAESLRHTVTWFVPAYFAGWLGNWCLQRFKPAPSLAQQAKAKEEEESERKRLARRAVDFCHPYGETVLCWDTTAVAEQGKTAPRDWHWNKLREAHFLGENLVLYFDQPKQPLLLVMQPDQEFLRTCRLALP